MEQKISHIIEKIATNNGFKNFKYSFELGSDLGFICSLKRCIIVEGNKRLSVMCKFLPQDSEQNSRFNSFLLYEREVRIYKELFPEFEKLHAEFGLKRSDLNGFWSYPKCYYCNYDYENPENSLIIMEDLTEDNFEIKNKYIPSDFNHTMKLFVELAKLHALSFALKHFRPDIFEKFKSLKNSMCSLMTTELMKPITPRNCELVSKLFAGENESSIREKVLSYKSNMWDKVAEIVNGDASEPYSVICHGDVWINNILYNYCDDKKSVIKDVKIVDWQMTYYGSVGSELMYYLYCCVDKTVRDKHQEELFQIYYNTMERFLRNFKLDISEVLPHNEFRNQLVKFGLYAFGMANFAIPLLCQYPEKLFEDEKCELTEEEQGYVKKYNKRMKDIILDLIDMKIL